VKELIERLREMARLVESDPDGQHFGSEPELLREAADAIEELALDVECADGARREAGYET
jgi:hypothetical protein